jgi:hypothetical protein
MGFTHENLDPRTAKIIASVADLFGISRTDVANRIERYKNTESPDDLLRQKKAISRFSTQNTLSTFTDCYYRGQRSLNDFAQYSIKLNDKTIKTTVFTTKKLVSVHRPLDEVKINLAKDIRLENNKIEKFSDYAIKTVARLITMGVKIWDAPLYRLTQLDLPKAVSFSLSNFVSHRFSGGLLEDELNDALIKYDGRVEDLFSNAHSLPIRDALLPTVDDISNVSGRICGGGIDAVFALRRGDHYVIPLHVRSQEVSDYRGFLALLPRGFHQPAIGDPEEVALKWTLFREIAEEIFGEDKAEKPSSQIITDWLFSHIPGLQWFQDHDSWKSEVVCFGFNAIAGNYDFGLMVMVEDSHYERKFREEMNKNWESDRIRWISTNNPTQISQAISEENWTGESLSYFVESLFRLKEWDPKRVKLPKIERWVGDSPVT